MDYDKYLQKTALSESVSHDRQKKAEDKKQMEGYAPHPKEDRLSELFGMKNSFDNISVGIDSKGSLAISVTSQKEPFSPTLTSDRKVLKGTRKRTLYDHFGEIYTNPFAPRDSAFAYRSRRVISENRITSEFKRAAQKRLSRTQREAVPFLTLDEDREALRELKDKHDNSPETAREIGRIEQSVLRKTEMENRFVRKLRMARFQNVVKPEEARRVMKSELYALTSGDVNDDDDILDINGAEDIEDADMDIDEMLDEIIGEPDVDIDHTDPDKE